MCVCVCVCGSNVFVFPIQTWVRSLSHGPNNKSLIANYQNSEVALTAC